MLWKRITLFNVSRWFRWLHSLASSRVKPTECFSSAVSDLKLLETLYVLLVTIGMYDCLSYKVGENTRILVIIQILPSPKASFLEPKFFL